MTLLQFAESIANHRSANLHGFHSDVVQAARRVVKENGGRLDAIGRYKADETEPMSWPEYERVKAQRRAKQ